eukprot:8802364-Pyramimonas_sp.AAC.1
MFIQRTHTQIPPPTHRVLFDWFSQNNGFGWSNFSSAAEETMKMEDGQETLIKLKGISLSGRPMYLDMQATTPMDPRVLDAMLPYFTEMYGNPHSRTHMYGWESEDAIEVGRKQVSTQRAHCSVFLECLLELTPSLVAFLRDEEKVTRTPGFVCWRAGACAPGLLRHLFDPSQVADIIGANPKEIIFTSGATESNNISIKGVARFYKSKKKHVITTQTDHKCVLDSCRALQQEVNPPEPF